MVDSAIHCLTTGCSGRSAAHPGRSPHAAGNQRALRWKIDAAAGSSGRTGADSSPHAAKTMAVTPIASAR